MKTESLEGYRFLDHVTDAFVESWGPSFERALVQAALGFFQTLVDVENVQSTIKEEIEASGHDRLELVYNWLEEFLLRFEINRMVFGEFEVQMVEERKGSFHLRALAWGEPYEPSRHGRKVEVKGVTYHQMEIEETSGKVVVRYLLDL